MIRAEDEKMLVQRGLVNNTTLYCALKLSAFHYKLIHSTLMVYYQSRSLHTTLLLHIMTEILKELHPVGSIHRRNKDQCVLFLFSRSFSLPLSCSLSLTDSFSVLLFFSLCFILFISLLLRHRISLSLSFFLHLALTLFFYIFLSPI